MAKCQMNINPNSGETPKGSGWANLRAPWLKGHPSLCITSVSWFVPEIPPSGASIFHLKLQAPWHKATPLHPNTFTRVVGKVQKNSPEGGRKGGWRKKCVQHARGGGGWLAGARAQTQDLTGARRRSPAACHGSCLDKPAFQGL